MSQKNAPTLASCSFDKHGLILIIFGKHHQHTSKNDMQVQLSLSLHFYLLYLLLYSCNVNHAFWHSSMFVKQSSSFSRKHRTSSVQICIRQTVRLTTEFLDWCRNVCTLYKHMSATPAAVTSDLKQRLIDTWASISQNVIDKAVGQCRKRRGSVQAGNRSLWTSAKLKPALFRATNSLPRKTRCFAPFPSQLLVL